MLPWRHHATGTGIEERRNVSMSAQAAIVGIGQTEFSKRIGTSEERVAYQAIRAAVADAGLEMRDVDGLVRYSLETNSDWQVAYNLGIPSLSYFACAPGGGNAGANTIQLAATAIAAGLANTIVCFRARNRGKHSSAGPGPFQGGRPWEKTATEVTESPKRYHAPYGLVAPAQEMAMVARRYMHEFGITEDHFGMVAVAQRSHAARNPHALMRTPMTLDDYRAARYIAEPLRLFDCCLESDGGGAVVVTSVERARGLPRKPAYILATGTASVHMTVPGVNYFKESLFDTESKAVAQMVYQRAGIGPADVDVAMIYDAFTPRVLIGLEDFGFCGRGEAGDFVADGHIQWPNGSIPVNTSGGSLSEVYLHGFNLILEAVRQIRGTSTAQVPDAKVTLMASGNFSPTSACILGSEPS